MGDSTYNSYYRFRHSKHLRKAITCINMAHQSLCSRRVLLFRNSKEAREESEGAQSFPVSNPIGSWDFVMTF